MKRAYKVGECVCCPEKILVMNCEGQITGPSPTYRNIKLHFEDGHVMMLPMCARCAEKPNLEEIVSNVCESGSQAFDCEKTKHFIQSKGKPRGYGIMKAGQPYGNKALNAG